jgi:hypothetical protein
MKLRHGGSNCSQYICSKIPQMLKSKLMFTEKQEPIDLLAQENLFDFIKGVGESVGIR